MNIKTVVKWFGVISLGIILGGCSSEKLVKRKEPDAQLVSKWVDDTRAESFWVFKEDNTGERSTPERRTFFWTTPYEGQVVVTLEATDKYPAERVTYSYQINEDKMKMWPKDVETLTSLFTRQK